MPWCPCQVAEHIRGGRHPEEGGGRAEDRDSADAEVGDNLMGVFCVDGCVINVNDSVAVSVKLATERFRAFISN